MADEKCIHGCDLATATCGCTQPVSHFEDLFEKWFAEEFGEVAYERDEILKAFALKAYLEGARKQKQDYALTAIIRTSEELGLYEKEMEGIPQKKFSPVTLAAGRLLKRR